MDARLVDATVDRIARALFDQWTRSPVIEFSEAVEDALFLEAVSRGSHLTGNQVADMSAAEIMAIPGIVIEYKDLVDQFLANLSKPEYGKVWAEIAAANVSAGKGTRNKARGAVISARNFFLKFVVKSKAPQASKSAKAADAVPVGTAATAAARAPDSGNGSGTGGGAAAPATSAGASGTGAGGEGEFIDEDWGSLLEDWAVNALKEPAPAVPAAAELLRVAHDKAAAVKAAHDDFGGAASSSAATVAGSGARLGAASSGAGAAATPAPAAALSTLPAEQQHSDTDVDDFLHGGVTGGGTSSAANVDGFDFDELPAGSLDGLGDVMFPDDAPSATPAAAGSAATYDADDLFD